MEAWVIPAAVAAGSGFMTFAMMSFWKSREAAGMLRQRIADLEAQHLVMMAQQEHIVSQVVPLNTAFQALLLKDLTHAHTPEMDLLLEKMGPPYVLTTEEESRLAVMLEERYRAVDPEVGERERDAARILPAVMKRVREEAAVLASIDVAVLPAARPMMESEAKRDVVG